MNRATRKAKAQIKMRNYVATHIKNGRHFLPVHKKPLNTVILIFPICSYSFFTGEIIKVYNSEEELNTDHHSKYGVYKVLKGSRQTYHNFYWKYYE